MAVRLMVMVVLFAGIFRSGFSQTISFNTPLPWVSLRNDSLTVRAQIDTSALKGKKLSLTVLTQNNGKSQTLASKTFTISDPSGEFSFGKLNRKLVGGQEFIRIRWEVKGTKETGDIAPVGIADLTKLMSNDTVKAVKIADGKTAKDAAAAIGEKLSAVGSISYGMAWNKEALYIAVKKGDGKETVKFGFDGKNGKNAFLSYPDRFVVCTPADSEVVRGMHFERSLHTDAIDYAEKDWRSSITHEIVGDVVLITVPWYDTGMIPFEKRTIGYAAFVENDQEKAVAATPKSADFYAPATWGTLLLLK